MNDFPRIRSSKPLFFSGRAEAEEVIHTFKDLYPFLYGGISQGERVYCLVLEEFELDLPYRYQLSTSVYSPEGFLLTDSMVPDDGPFCGRSEKSIHHEIGDVVELPFGDQLIFGIVVEKPMSLNEVAGTYGLTASDDCYTVIHHKTQEVNYAYAPMVFKPTREVAEEVREELLSAFNEMTKDKN
ncbi:MAG: hypothetical protein PHT07_22125 [Paludibacter sp.]|nr:hypothetical protein [Paludibacter sp.]